MKIKPILAELFKNIALPIDEYGSLPEAQFFFNNIPILEEVERFHLPEVTKVICSNDLLLNIPVFLKYRIIRNIYIAQNDNVYIQLLTNINPEDVINNVLPLIDEITLRKIYSFRDAWVSGMNKLAKDAESKKGKLQSLKARLEEDQQKQVQKETELNSCEPTEENKKHISTLKGAITKLKKQLEINQEEVVSLETDLSKIDTQLRNTTILLERNANLFAFIQSTLDGYNRITSISRDEAYKLEIESPAKILIDSVITNDDTPDQRNKLRDKAFCQSVIAEFSSYDSMTVIDVISKLYYMGDIDINEGVFQEYIINHMNDVCGYMVSQYRDTTPDQNESYKSWLEFIIEQLAAFGYEAHLSIFWNSISQNGTWQYIFDSIMTEYPDQSLDLLCLLCLNVEGGAAKLLITHLKTMIAAGDIFGYTVSDFTTALLAKECNAKSRQIVRDIIQRYEADLKSTKRKLNVAEREISERSADIFRTLYEAIENLEILATNYASSQNQIPYEVMKKNLINSVADLRNSMENLEVYTVEKTDTWSSQTVIEFDSETHECDNLNSEDKVKLRTLGFKYQDSEGEWHIIPAKVLKIPKKDNKPTPTKSFDKHKRDTDHKHRNRRNRQNNKAHPKNKGDKK